MGTITKATTCTKAGGGYFKPMFHVALTVSENVSHETFEPYCQTQAKRKHRKETGMDLENWVIELLDDIKEAAEKGENYDLHMEAVYVKDVAKAYNESKWIEIY